MSDMNYNLNPCPFCGANVKAGCGPWLESDQYHYSSVLCTCGASGPKADSQEKAIMAWNCRAYSVQDLLWDPFDFQVDNDELSGKLNSIDFSCILQLLSSESKTGVLHLSHGRKVSALYLKEGKVIAASSNYAPRLGQILFDKGLLSLKKLQKVLNRAKATGKRVGEMLLDLGYISQDTLRAVISQQINETVQELVLWNEGEYQYRDYTIEFDERAIEDISTVGMMLDAFRKLDELNEVHAIV